MFAFLALTVLIDWSDALAEDVGRQREVASWGPRRLEADVFSRFLPGADLPWTTNEATGRIRVAPSTRWFCGFIDATDAGMTVGPPVLHHGDALADPTRRHLRAPELTTAAGRDFTADIIVEGVEE